MTKAIPFVKLIVVDLNHEISRVVICPESMIEQQIALGEEGFKVDTSVGTIPDDLLWAKRTKDKQGRVTYSLERKESAKSKPGDIQHEKLDIGDSIPWAGSKDLETADPNNPPEGTPDSKLLQLSWREQAAYLKDKGRPK